MKRALVVAAMLAASTPVWAQFWLPSRETIDKVIGLIDKGRDFDEDLEDAAEAARDYRTLNPDDARFDPDYSPPGMPEVPISCQTSNCEECYATAQRRLNFMRVQLEKLRAVYQSTKTYADKMKSFGDSASGIHAVSGLAWQAQKKGIDAEMKKLERTYDQKYTGMMRGLLNALKDVDQCEQTYMKTPDWYQRFGFIYYSFMEDRYRR